jgi:Mg-chelatase subunit ChlD
VSIVDGAIYMPAALDDVGGGDGLTLYRAAAAHATAHLIHSAQRFPLRSLRPIQVALVSLVEDARVEHLATRDVPGLWKLWRPFHVARPSGLVSAESLMARLARALCDPGYRDDNAWVGKGRAMFAARAASLEDQALSRTIGMLLGNDLGQMRLSFNAKTFLVEPRYRDDNLFVWDLGVPPSLPPESQRVIRTAARRHFEDGAGSEPPRLSQNPEEARGRSAPASPWNQDENHDDALAHRHRYDEWDYTIGVARTAWCTLLDQRARPGDAGLVEAALARHHETVTRVTRLVKIARVGRAEWRRRQLEGDALDLDACVEAAVSMRSDRPPDPRVHRSYARRRRDLAVLVLLDLSRSTGEPVPAAGTSVLELERDATALIAEAMNRIGDDFAIHGFNSDGRHGVAYYRVKDLGERYDDLARARLAGLTAQFSTRIGTALRHAGRILRHSRAATKLVLVVTDGVPHDVDVHDPRYLVFDARRAVVDLARAGIAAFCIRLDTRAERQVAGIFGARNHVVLEHVGRLPDTLATLYPQLTAG